MKQYTKTYRVLVENSISYMAQYRKDTWIKFATNALWLAMLALTIEVIFSFTPELGGWERHEVYLLTVFWLIADEIFVMFFGGNITELPNIVTDGKFDLYLVKPISPLFLVSTRFFSLNSVWRLGIQMIILAWLGLRFDFTASVWHIALAPLLILCAVAIDYSIVLMLNTLSFWFHRIDNVNDLWQVAHDLGKYPVSVLPKTLKIFAFTLVPIAFSGYVPAAVLTGHWPLYGAALAVGAAAMFLLAAISFFRFAQKHYSSASS